jgi:hypothetical protein
MVRVSKEFTVVMSADPGGPADDVQRSPEATPLANEHGQPRYEQLMGEWRCDLRLGDVAGPKTDRG